MCNADHSGDCRATAHVRDLHRTIFGGNHANIADDIRLLAKAASWAVLHGMPDELAPAALPAAKKRLGILHEREAA